MGKKMSGVLIVGLLIATFFPIECCFAGSTHILINGEIKQTNELTSVIFSPQPELSEKDGFLEVKLQGTTTQLLNPTKPELPIYVRTFQIPFRSTAIDVRCAPLTVHTMTISKEIIPARVSRVLTEGEEIEYEKDPVVYETDAVYPNSWFSVHLGAGRNENDQQVTFVKVTCYPVRISSVEKKMLFTEGFTIKVTYEKPKGPPQSSGDSYDMVVIAPAAFEPTLQKLVDFKNNKGIMTLFKSVEDISNTYEGYDPPEQIKNFMKDAFDNWGITYALLVGGLKSHIYAKDKDTVSAGWNAWWVPVRYVRIPHVDDEACLCDLYYGCLYNENGTFDSWDSNGDGVYAAWNAPGVGRDTFDMYPEVYVGRLPVANKIELDHIINKIIKYESTIPIEKPWYNTFIGIGGKTSVYYEGKPDGEYLCDLAYNYTKQAISGLTLLAVYSTNRDTGSPVPDKKGISTSFSKGAGFIDFQGHGSPAKWDTIWFDGVYPEDWVGGLGLQNFWRVRNGDKQPIMVVGGCHNAMYNISLIPAMKDKTGTTYFTYGFPIPVCFCWGMMIKPTGGAIASTGSTGYGIGYVGHPVSLSGALETNFFYQIGQGSTHMGQAHSRAIQKFIADEEIQQTEAFVITNWALLGDPSLHFGGY